VIIFVIYKIVIREIRMIIIDYRQGKYLRLFLFTISMSLLLLLACGLPVEAVTDAGSNSPDTYSYTVTPPSVSAGSAYNITSTSAILVASLDDMGTAGSVNVYFEYGRTSSYGYTTSAQVMTKTGSFNAQITGLSSGTTYHFRAKADGGESGSATSSDITFTTWTPPKLVTVSAIDVASTAVTVRGNLLDLGTAGSVNMYFEYGADTSYGSTTSVQVKTTTGSVSTRITGLSPGTTYHYRVKGDAGIHGISSGSDMTFFTTPEPPVVTTSMANNITYDTAQLNGNLAYMGTASEVNVSFEYGLTTAYGNISSSDVFSNISVFDLTISGLAPGTTYHYRAKADGGVHGISYGADRTFTTVKAIAPAMSMVTANNVSYTTAKLVGNLSSMGTADSVSVTFEYGLTDEYGYEVEPDEGPAGVGKDGGFSVNLTKLSPGTTYHYRAKADGGVHGVAYTEDMTFTTLGTSTAAVVTVTTSEADILAVDTVVLNGDLISMGNLGTVYVYFEFGTSVEYGGKTESQKVTGTGMFDARVTGLLPGTVYHYRAVVNDGIRNLSVGSDTTFSTDTIPPDVITLEATNVGDTTATINATLLSLGTADAVDVSFEYGTSRNYGKSTTIKQLTSAGDFSAVLTKLQPDTTYYFRAIADGGVHGTVNGNEIIFRTQATSEISIVDSSLIIHPSETTPGTTVVIKVSVSNMGGATSTYPLELMINGVTEMTKEVTVDAGKVQAVSFDVVREKPGTYVVDVNGVKGSFTIKESVTSTTEVPNNSIEPSNNRMTTDNLFLIIVAIVGVLVALTIFLLRRSERR
jgi:phosphodiesterase/alkaline phosphatase D-like protein